MLPEDVDDALRLRLAVAALVEDASRRHGAAAADGEIDASAQR